MKPGTALRAVAVLAAMAALSACTGGKDAVDQGAGSQFRYVQGTNKGTVIDTAKRKVAGPVAGSLLAGGDYTLASDRGHVVVLNFFASWCGPCQNETPQFDTIYRQRKAVGVRFVGLDVKDPSRSASQAWLRAKNVSFPVLYDEAAKSAIQLGDIPVAALPSTVVIDKQGKVAAIYVGSVLPKDLEPVLDSLGKEA